MSEPNPQGNLTLMTEIQNRLRITEERAATVIRTLEKDQSMQDSINAASKGLHETSAAVAEFADKTKKATEVFLDSVSALKEVTNVLQQMSPSDLQQKLDQITPQIAKGSEQLQQNIDAVNKRVDQKCGRLQESVEAVNKRVDQNGKQLREGVEAVNKRIDQKGKQLQEGMEVVNNRADENGKQLQERIEAANGRIDQNGRQLQESMEVINARVDQNGRQLKESIEQISSKVTRVSILIVTLVVIAVILNLFF